MGGEVAKKPGATTLAMQSIGAAPTTPGKATLVNTTPVNNTPRLDIPYIRDENKCHGDTNDCMLSQHQRDMYVGAFQDNVNAQLNSYTAALLQLWTENLVHKEEELPIILTFLLDAVTARALKGLGKAWTWLTSVDPQSALEVMRGDALNKLDQMLSSLRKYGTGPATGIMKMATDAGKKIAKSSMSAGGGDKQQTAGFLNFLLDRSAVVFEQQRLLVPGLAANDTDLILIERASRADMGHHASDYKTEISELLARFKSSPASKIGRSAHPHAAELGAPDQRETKVAWVAIDGDPVPLLYYLKMDYRMDRPAPNRLSSMPGSAPMRPVDESFQLLQPVEAEFVDAAIASHTQAWGTPPGTRRRSRQELAAETGDVSLLRPRLPRLDLGKPAPKPLPADNKVSAGNPLDYVNPGPVIAGNS